MPSISLLLTYAQAYGCEPPTLEEFRTRLKALPKLRLVMTCGVLNALLRPKDGEPVDISAHDGIVSAFLPKKLADILRNHAKGILPRVVFSRQGLLFVAKEAFLHASEDETLPLENATLGEIFLMANDFMHFENLGASKETLDQFVKATIHMIPVQEAGSDRVRHKMLRSFQMTSATSLNRFRNEAFFFDIPKLFEESVGIPLSVFYALAVGALSRFAIFNPIDFVKQPQSYVLNGGWFASTKISPDNITNFLKYVSEEATEFKSHLTPSGGPSDFTAFRSKPLLKIADGLHLIDLWFLAEKYESGPFWSIFSSLSAEDKPRFFSFWGLLFETYMSNILTSACDGKKNVLHVAPKFSSSGEEVCDAIVICGKNAIFIEMKGGTFTAKSKYGGSVAVLRKELEAKLIRSEDREQAVHQLARNIFRAFGRHKEDIEGLNVQRISTIYPLVITRDDIGAMVGVNAFLDYCFREVVRRDELSVAVAPLICMSSENAEAVSAYLKETPLAAILSAHISANRRSGGKYMMAPMFAAPNKELTKIGERVIPNQQEEWNALMTTMLEELGIEAPEKTPWNS
jgi:hypothetical protein